MSGWIELLRAASKAAAKGGWSDPSFFPLERRPDMVGVTSWFTIHTANGLTRYEAMGAS